MMETFNDGSRTVRVLNMDAAIGRYIEIDAVLDGADVARVNVATQYGARSEFAVSATTAKHVGDAFLEAAEICFAHNVVSRPPTDAETGDPRFKAILDQMWALHQKKGADYGSDEDQFSNVRASAAFGVAPWVGTMIRANDKMKRIQTMAAKGVLQNESVEDSLVDLAAYAIIALVLYREGQGA